jgi:hypothetical protein
MEQKVTNAAPVDRRRGCSPLLTGTPGGGLVRVLRRALLHGSRAVTGAPDGWAAALDVRDDGAKLRAVLTHDRRAAETVDDLRTLQDVADGAARPRVREELVVTLHERVAIDGRRLAARVAGLRGLRVEAGVTEAGRLDRSIASRRENDRASKAGGARKNARKRAARRA